MSSSSQSPNLDALDGLTGGAFTAPTSGERAARLRQWLATDPAASDLQEAFKELSARDKGAARLIRERLDELRRARGQEAIVAEWAAKAKALLGQSRLNIADAIAWQRDAAKAGAPLSREPLAALKSQLAERVKAIEDLQHRVQVQREAAVLLAQRIEVLSTKSWRDAQAAATALSADVPQWQAQAEALVQEAGWPSVEPRFPALLEASRTQLQVVWEAFRTALAQAAAAETDPAAPLPAVPVWADELRVARGLPPEAETPKPAPRTPRAPADPQQRAQAQDTVQSLLTRLQADLAQGHGKAVSGAAQALRQALKAQAGLIEAALEQQAHAALANAGEMEGWQRWRTDQLRRELVAQAEALFEAEPAAGSLTDASPATAGEVSLTPTVVTAEAPAPADPAAPTFAEPTPAAAAVSGADAPAERRPRYTGRKMQEQLRHLRDQWKQLDKAAPPNHALWKRFDDACNRAHAVVEVWLHKVKAESSEHKARRLALIEDLQAWAAAPAAAPADWKAYARGLHQFESRWREAGHLSEKAYAELHPQWKQALQAAQAPLSRAQKDSLARRHALIDEARALGDAPQLRIDAVKALQQRWQVEAHAVPLERRQEQKLWDAFRKPIDEAFQRKSQARDAATATLSERDRAVLEASRAVEAANAGGDAQKIREALARLEAALKGQAQARADVAVADAPSAETLSAEMSAEAAAPTDTAPAKPIAKPPAPARPVVAMRGDDRPGAKRPETGGRAPVRPGGRDERRRPGEREMGRGRGPGRDGHDVPRDDRGPRLSDTAFRAQREAMDHAQATLRKLAAQAHGEALVQLLSAWEQRRPDAVPAQSALGKSVTPAMRGGWVQAIGAAPGGDPAQSLLRLEIAADIATPAEHLPARRLLQLQLLTRRNDPVPTQTWAQDTAQVLASAHESAKARRLQSALKVLMRAGA